nr:helix-turn-helix transcriptional regulator [uncultured Clostridium sp.]
MWFTEEAGDGGNNICGQKIREIREKLPEKTSQRKLADMLQKVGLDIDKNAVQRIESGRGFVTDIELKVIAEVLEANYQDLLDD